MKQRKGVFSFLTVLCFALILSVKSYAVSYTERLQGEDRYKTAAAITNAKWQASENVVLSTGEDFPDALCAAPLASRLNAPILLTGRAVLNLEAADEITRLKARNVYIIGGPGVISLDIENSLKSKGINCIRLYGSDRYKTSIEVAKYLSQKFGSSKEIVAATGDDFPDALSIAPIAAKKGIPIILSPRDYVTDDIKRYISDNGISKSYIIGGTGVLRDTAASSFPNAERISGSDRYLTNRAIIDRFSGELNFSTVYVATGENFPDALSGSALAPMSSSPIVLVSEHSKGTAKNLMDLKMNSITRIVILGGEGAVSSYLVQMVLPGSSNTTSNETSNTPSFNATPQAVINETAKVMDEEKSKQFAETIKDVKVVSELESTLTFDKSSEYVKSLSPGDIFVVRPTNEMPMGYIGKIVSNSTNANGEIVVNVEQPTFDEIFSEVYFKTEKVINISDIADANLPKGAKLHASSSKNPSYGNGDFKLRSGVKDTNINDDIIDEIAISFENANIFKSPKKDRSSGKEWDFITLNGMLGLKDTRIIVEFDNRRAFPKKSISRLQTTLTGDLGFTADLDASLSSKDINKNFQLFKNERKIGKKITYEGVDMDDEIILASLTIGFGTIPITPKVGPPVMVPIGAAVLITMTFDGEIKAVLNAKLNYSCYIDAGIEYNKKTGFTNYNTFKPKSVWPEVELSASGKVTVSKSLGVSVVAIAMNIIPAKIDAKLRSDIVAEGEVKYSTASGGSADMKLTKELKFVVDAAAAFGVEVDLGKKRGRRWEYEAGLINKTLFKESYPKAKKGNTSGNIAHAGTACENEEYIFYLQSDGSNEYGFGKFNIYRRKKDTGKTERITDFNNGGDSFYRSMNVIGDWIYYTGGGIKKIKIDGTQKETIIGKTADSMIVAGEWIYYHHYNGITSEIRKIKTDGTYDMKLCDVGIGLECISVEGDWIYYSVLEGIYKVKTDGTDNRKIFSGNSTSMNVEGQWIYYIVDDGLYRMKDNGSLNTIMISRQYIDGLNISEGYVYYFDNFSGNTRIGKIKLDGTGEKVLYEGKGWTLALNIAGEWMFYATHHHGGFNEKMMQKNIDEHWEQ